MTHEHQHRTDRIVAAFATPQRAQDALEALRGTGVAADALNLQTGSGDGDRRAAARGEMREEVDRSFAGPGLFTVGGKRAASALAATLGFGFVGALIGAVIGLFWASTANDLSVVLRIVIPTIAFAVGGGAAGFIAGGAWMTRREGQRDPRRAYDDATLAEERDVILGVRTSTEDEAEQVFSILQRHDPDRIDRLDAEGEPLAGFPPERPATS